MDRLKPGRIASFGAVLIAIGTIALAMGQAVPSDVLAVGSLSAASVKDSELLRFTLSVTNRTSSAIDSVRLIGPPDSYLLDSVCVVLENKGINCFTQKDFSVGHGLLWKVLAPGQTVSAWGYLKPTVAHKPTVLTVLVAWDSSSAPYPSQSATVVALGKNEVWDSTALIETRSYEVLKILLSRSL